MLNPPQIPVARNKYELLFIFLSENNPKTSPKIKVLITLENKVPIGKVGIKEEKNLPVKNLSVLPIPPPIKT